MFVKLPPEVLKALRASGHRFYTDVGPGGAARLMCSWDTTEDDVSVGHFIYVHNGLEPLESGSEAHGNYSGEIHSAGSNGIAFIRASGTVNTSGVSPI